MKTLIFRVDASRDMGSGHLMRCLALAESLSQRGAEVLFVSRTHPGHMMRFIHERALPLIELPDPRIPPTRAQERYASWLGVTQEEDADQTVAALGGSRPDWLIVDHYAIDANWERLLRPHVGRLMVIDDLANREHDCDVLVDQNYSAKGGDRYRGLVPDRCAVLAGPRYALLAPEYAAFRRIQHARGGPVRRVLVFFGGTDPHDMTGLALEALAVAGLRDLHLDIVVGASYPHREHLERLAAQRPGTVVHGMQPHLAALMATADLAIGAGGVTMWERMCLGLPSVVISTAENQLPASRALADIGCIQYAGHWAEARAQGVARLVKSLVGSPADLARLGRECKALVDGYGASRVAEALVPSKWSDVRVRTAGGFRFQLEAQGAPVGELALTTDGSDAIVELCPDPVAAANGWETFMVGAAARLVRHCGPALVPGAGRLPYLRSTYAGRDVPVRYAIQVLSDDSSWMNEYVSQLLAQWLDDGHRVRWVHDHRALAGGDLCFLLGCSQIIARETRAQLRHCLVVHESDVPRGKGWSPLTWEILQGAGRVAVTLIEAADKVDSGDVYAQEWVAFEGHELVGELRAAVARAALGLCRQFVAEYPASASHARSQSGAGSHYARRRPEDSRLDPAAAIASQFNLLRVVDNARYPAFFEHADHRYELRIRKTEPT